MCISEVMMKQYTDRTFDQQDLLLMQYPAIKEQMDPTIRVTWADATERVKKAKRKQKEDGGSIIRKAAQQAMFVKTGG